MSSLQSRIARRARISQSTVSRALSNHPALPQATCKRVQQIARQLGYEPNPLVSSVFSAMRRRQNRTSLGTLAFLMAHATRDGWKKVATYRDFFLGAQARATKQGFDLETHWAAEPGITGPRLGDILQARGIAGVIVSTRASTENFPELPWDKFALVRIGLSQKKLPFHCVVNHQFNTARLVAGELASRGYARIGLAVTAWQNEVADQGWLGGFLVWQQSQPAARRVPAKIFPALTAEAFIDWFQRHRPDVIISVNPDVIDLLRAANYKVPEDVGVALLDWHDNYGDIAGADQNNRLVGSKAVDILLAQLQRNEHGIPDHPFRMSIESSWREGSTVRPSRKP
jgi:LacI family transcriptional regulator